MRKETNVTEQFQAALTNLWSVEMSMREQVFLDFRLIERQTTKKLKVYKWEE